MFWHNMIIELWLLAWNMNWHDGWLLDTLFASFGFGMKVKGDWMVINVQIKWQIIFNPSPNLKFPFKRPKWSFWKGLAILEVAPETKHEIYWG